MNAASTEIAPIVNRLKTKKNIREHEQMKTRNDF